MPDWMCRICSKTELDVTHQSKCLSLRDEQRFLEQFWVRKRRSQKTYLEVSTTLLKWFKDKKRFLEQFLVQNWRSQKSYLEMSTTSPKWFKDEKLYLHQILFKKRSSEKTYYKVCATPLTWFKDKKNFWSSFDSKVEISKNVLRSVYDASKVI